MYDVIIIGMGISGITAGIYAKRAGMNVLMLEKNIPGGVISSISKIYNYPGFSEISGPDLAMNLFNQVKSLEIPYKMEEVIDLKFENNKKIIVTNKNEYECQNVVIATGRMPKFLGLDNEKDYLGRGVSTCATCDGALYKDECVAVVGSGNSALCESIYLASLAKKVYLLHRKETFTGEKGLLKKVKETDNIEIIDNVTVEKINEENGKINSVLLSNNRILNVKGIFIYVGYRPNTDIFKNLNILDESGNIETNERCKTKLDGIYAVGDCIKKDIYQLVSATADGCTAINSIEKDRV